MKDKNGVSIPWPGMTLEEEILELREEIQGARNVEKSLRASFAECGKAYHEAKKELAKLKATP